MLLEDETAKSVEKSSKMEDMNNCASSPARTTVTSTDETTEKSVKKTPENKQTEMTRRKLVTTPGVRTTKLSLRTRQAPHSRSSPLRNSTIDLTDSNQSTNTTLAKPCSELRKSSDDVTIMSFVLNEQEDDNSVTSSDQPVDSGDPDAVIVLD